MELSGRRYEKEFFLAQVKETLSEITGMQAFIHRIVLSNRKIFYKDLKQQLNIEKPLRPLEGAEADKEPCYGKTVTINISGCDVVIIAEPKKNREKCRYRPWWKLDITNPTPEALCELNYRLGKLYVSRAEYTLDIYCNDTKTVASIFYVLRKCMWVPLARRTELIGGQFNGIDDFVGNYNRVENLVYRITKKIVKKISKASKNTIDDKKAKKETHAVVTMYERGHDELAHRKNMKPFWEHQHTDRVRIEFKFNRRAGHHKTHHISTLGKMLIRPKFRAIFNKVVKFRMFEGSTKLPYFWERYPATDKAGNIDSFQEQNYYSRKIGVNVALHRRYARFLKFLTLDIYKALRAADRDWVKRAKLYSETLANIAAANNEHIK